jgi:hypothetical protein
LSDQIHHSSANTNGTQNFHRSPVMSQFQPATGPMPARFIAMTSTPMMTNNMGAPSNATGAGECQRLRPQSVILTVVQRPHQAE